VLKGRGKLSGLGCCLVFDTGFTLEWYGNSVSQEKDVSFVIIAIIVPQMF
jgi:hypothetical protein